MGRHAYLIVVNANLKVLEKCLQVIDDSRNSVYVLVDSKSHKYNEVRQLLNCTLKRVEKCNVCEQIVNWGGYSQISAVLTLVRMVNTSGIKYDYLHFFQGSDMPIKTQNEIHRYFDNNIGKEFVSVEKNHSLMAQNKAWYRHFFCHNRFFRTNKLIKILNFGFVYLQKTLHIRKNLDINLYQGSALFSITGECAHYIESQITNIHKRFRYSLAADEVFLQSVLMNSSYRDKIKDINKNVSSNARMIDRTRPDGQNSPHIWRVNEFDFLMSLPEEYCFARKFDEKVDFEIVERIYQTIKDIYE